MFKSKILLWSLFSVGIYAGDVRILFESSEQVMTGEDITLPSVTGKLHLANGLQMTFGGLVAMGDFYREKERARKWNCMTGGGCSSLAWWTLPGRFLAFACHFLTDYFSAGHIRVPRVELPEHVTPAIVGSLLSGLMHNKQGERWIAYGDGRSTPMNWLVLAPSDS